MAMGLDRRGFLKAGTLGAVGSALGFSIQPARAQGPAVTGPSARTAKNLIFMVSDGMSFGTLSLAEMASRHKFEKSSHWVTLFGKKGVRRSAVSTRAADSLVTDSAAGASAWGCGFKVNNSVVNITPDGVQRLPLLVQARQAGKATGVVSTARVTHATPAGFYANAPVRNLENDIAQDWLERGIDLAIGGGGRHFPKKALDAHPDVRVARTRSELRAAGDGDRDARLLGLIAESHVPFELDRLAGIADGKADEVPTIAEMSSLAVARLAACSRGKDQGFVLQIEGGRIDHAAHNNDAGTLVSEQLAFDAALGAMMEFVEGRDDTLLVVTTDHGNANPGLTVYDEASFKAFDRLLGVKRSFDWITDRVGKGKPEEHMEKLPEAVAMATGVELRSAEKDMMRRVLSGERVSPFSGLNSPTSVLGGILANSLGVGFVSGNHTADQVEFTSFGPGSERFPGEIENNDVHAVLAEALKLPAGVLLPGMDEVAKPAKKIPTD